MGEELDKPEKTFAPKDDNNIYVKYGFNQVQGWKKSMEDFSIDFLEPVEKKFMNIFGIFDGHGGKEVPKYLQVHFLEFLNKNKNFISEKYKEGITETFFDLDKSFREKEAQEELAKYAEEFKPDKEKEIKEINDLCSPNEKLNQEELEQVMAFNEVFDPRNIENANIAEFTGATGMIIAVCYNQILIAFAGNSRCLILDDKGKVIKSTKDHTMKDENEKKRVDLARSFNDEEEEKKKGEDEHMEYLDSTRGFGDLEFKGNEWIDQKNQEISVEPEIELVPYDNAKYIIFGSHGMFEGDEDKVNNEVGKFFFDEIQKGGDVKFSEIIQKYFEKIISKEKNNEKNIGLDNMSCFVVELKKDKIDEFIKIKDEEIKEEKRKEEERKRKQKEEEMKKRQEEKKKREEERKRREEEKKKKEEDKKNGIEKKEEKPEDKKEEKPEEKKEEKPEDKKEEKPEEKKEEKPEDKKEEKPEEKKEEIQEDKKEEKPEEKKEEKVEEKKEEKVEEKKEEKIEEKQEEKQEEKKDDEHEEKKEEKAEDKPEENKEIKEEKTDKEDENKIEKEKKEEEKKE